jgi:hypothetical protein
MSKVHIMVALLDEVSNYIKQKLEEKQKIVWFICYDVKMSIYPFSNALF